jgi:hypothetical protein
MRTTGDATGGGIREPEKFIFSIFQYFLLFLFQQILTKRE